MVNNTVTPIDYGESWHPGNSVLEERIVHSSADEWLTHAPHPTPLPHALIDAALAHASKLRQLARQGTAGLPANQRDEAAKLLDEKLAYLQQLRQHPAPTLSHLPLYRGLIREAL